MPMNQHTLHQLHQQQLKGRHKSTSGGPNNHVSKHLKVIHPPKNLLNKRHSLLQGFPGGSDSKESTCNAGDTGSVHGLGRSPGEGNGKPLQYSGLENPMDRGAWGVRVHGVAKSWTRLSDFHMYQAQEHSLQFQTFPTDI